MLNHSPIVSALADVQEGKNELRTTNCEERVLHCGGRKTFSRLPGSRLEFAPCGSSQFAVRNSQFAFSYQLALRTPGMNPLSDISRKQIRQRPNFRRNARDLPQRWQRLCCLTANFGFRLLFSIIAFRAILFSR
jgi:hypothetical protein